MACAISGMCEGNADSSIALALAGHTFVAAMSMLLAKILGSLPLPAIVRAFHDVGATEFSE